VVHNPVTGETYHASLGGGAFLRGEPIRVAGPERRRVLASRSEIGRGEFDRFGEGWTVHPMGSTAYRMVKVADGTGDATLSRRTKNEWDLCAAEVVVAEAGGRVTDALGGTVRYNRPEPRVPGVVAARAALHDAVRAVPAS
ncbi:MAG TPA: inositol monophosphatase family protein, partial [Longimicrobiaceae bacterium]